MSYYSAFRIKNTSGLKIPKENIVELKNKIKEVSEKIEFIDNLDDETITGKQYKEYQKEKEALLKPIIVQLSPSFKITNDEFTFETYYSEKDKLLYFDGKRIFMMLDEGETFSFEDDGKFYIGDGKFYASSNYDWILEMVQDFIRDFNGSAIIEDMGDEEHGFVYEDGCDRDLNKPDIWENGKVSKKDNNVKND